MPGGSACISSNAAILLRSRYGKGLLQVDTFTAGRYSPHWRFGKEGRYNQQLSAVSLTKGLSRALQMLASVAASIMGSVLTCLPCYEGPLRRAQGTYVLLDPMSRVGSHRNGQECSFCPQPFRSSSNSNSRAARALPPCQHTPAGTDAPDSTARVAPCLGL